MLLSYTAILEPCEEGGYTVQFPDLPGCFTEGNDLTEALYMAQDAASGYILSELEDGNEIPSATKQSDISCPDGCIKNMIVLDLDEYASKYSSKAVKKTLTIPAWMNSFVEKYHISCSKLLQDAINKAIQSDAYLT